MEKNELDAIKEIHSLERRSWAYMYQVENQNLIPKVSSFERP